MVLILLAFLIDSSFGELATCKPQNRECSCADTSSRVSVFLVLKAFELQGWRLPVRRLTLKWYQFSLLIYYSSLLKLRTVRTSSHQRGSMWTRLRIAWSCVRWSASKESQPVHFKYLRKPTMWPLFRRSTPLGSVNGCSSTTAQPRRNWVSFHLISTVRYKTTSITTLKRAKTNPTHIIYLISR